MHDENDHYHDDWQDHHHYWEDMTSRGESNLQSHHDEIHAMHMNDAEHSDRLSQTMETRDDFLDVENQRLQHEALQAMNHADDDIPSKKYAGLAGLKQTPDNQLTPTAKWICAIFLVLWFSSFFVHYLFGRG